MRLSRYLDMEKKWDVEYFEVTQKQVSIPSSTSRSIANELLMS